MTATWRGGEGGEEMGTVKKRMGGVLRGIFRSEQKNNSSEETVDKHQSLDRRGLSRLERYNQSVTELQPH